LSESFPFETLLNILYAVPGIRVPGRSLKIE
jgi:hypothetical protein